MPYNPKTQRTIIVSKEHKVLLDEIAKTTGWTLQRSAEQSVEALHEFVTSNEVASMSNYPSTPASYPNGCDVEECMFKNRMHKNHHLTEQL